MINIQEKDTSMGHFYVSLVKSVIRFVAGGVLVAGGLGDITIYTSLIAAGTAFMIAEALGVMEELV